MEMLLTVKPDMFEEEQGSVSAHHELQVPHGHVCRGSAYGWLFLTNGNLDMKLLNPFSGAEIQLPPITTLVSSSSIKLGEHEHWSVDTSIWCVNKAVFSANPSIEPRPVVFIICNGKFFANRPAFCKPGDKGWTLLEFSKCSVFMDAIYHKGQFYGLSWMGYVVAFDIGRCINDDDHSVKTTLIATPSVGSLYLRNFDPMEPKVRDSYLVVLDGELVKFELRSVSFHDSCIDNETKEFLEREMNRDGDTNDSDEDFNDVDYFGYLPPSTTKIQTEATSNTDDGKKVRVVDPRLYCVDSRARSCTYSIKIRRLDASKKQWVKVESLGDKAVFLGFNTSFAISASDYPAGVCIPDSVYFIDGGGTYNMLEESFYDMGIYNVKDKRLKPLYPQMDDASKFIKPAPIWIVNSTDR